MTQPQRFYLSTGTPTYSYNADTQQATVYSRVTGAKLCEVSGVNLYVGNLLSRLADESYQDGYELGRKHALESIADKIASMQRS